MISLIRSWERTSVVFAATLGLAACGDDGMAGSSGSTATATATATSTSTATSTGDSTLTNGESTMPTTMSTADGTETGTETGSDQGPPMACPGVTPPSDPVCRDNTDCDEFLECVPVASDCPGPGCASDCDLDADCDDFDGAGSAGVCVFTGVGCCGGAGNCALSCSDPGADPCADDETCEPDGHCRPIPCDDGFDCTEGTRCEPETTGADRHGCIVIPCDEPDALACPSSHTCEAGSCTRLPCQLDADCPCGACIDSGCWERPWFCYEPPA